MQCVQASANKSILGTSGFLAAFSLIFLSEIGDKTFFIAGLLATRVRPSVSSSVEADDLYYLCMMQLLKANLCRSANGAVCWALLQPCPS